MKRLYVCLLIIASVTLLVAVGVAGVKRIIRPIQVTSPESMPPQSVSFESSERATSKTTTSDAEPSLDQEIQAGFFALKDKDSQTARKHFEDAVRLFDGKPSTSQWLLTKLSLSPSNSVVTVNGKPKNVSRQVDGYRQVMGTQQALYEFAAFSVQLSGDDHKAETYFDKVNEMRGVMWGKSWIELVPQIHRLFFSYVTPDQSERFGKYLLMAGRLLLDAEDSGALELIRRAKLNLPKDARVSALIASHLIVNHDPGGAKSEAQASLALNPNQPSVLIDLATAEWMLGELEPATSAARKATELDSGLPGPHATLAFVALETGDNSLALSEAELGNKLSNGHTFFKTILAVSFAASGNQRRAEQLMSEAWDGGSPNERQLVAWFFRGKPLEYARRFIKPGR